MKKLLAVLIALCMVLPCVSAFAVEVDQFAVEGDFEYEEENGEITILRCNETVVGDVIIPDTILNMPVVKIGASAFEFCADMTSVTIPQTVTEIDEFAFVYCWSLTEINLSDNVKSIGTSAFEACSALVNVNIGSGLESIGNYAFASCSSLENITVSEANETFKSKDGILYSKDGKKLVIYPGARATNVVISENIETVGISAFDCCDQLTSIVLPEGLKTIETYVFNGCSSLTNVTLPQTLEVIDDGAFRDCISLEKIVIPSNVSSIGASAFSGCEMLSNIEFKGMAPEIGKDAFSAVSEALNITCLPQNATSFAPNGETTFMGYPLIISADTAATLDLIPDSSLVIKNSILTGINAGTTAEALLAEFVSGYALKVMHINGTELVATDSVGTGYKVVLTVGEETQELTICVIGDVTGDAKVNSRDIASMQRHIMETAVLENAFFVAGDVNSDENINSRDLARVQKTIANS